MPSRPPAPQWPSNTFSDIDQFSDGRQPQPRDLRRPLPAPPSSLPNDYEIPTLRRKPLPEDPNVGQSRHARSLSNPISSLFGTKRQERKVVDNDEQADSSDDDMIKAKRSASKSKKTQRSDSQKTVDKQPVTGNCMACDSTVRWPKDLKVFRCTTCLTINDLEPFDSQLQTQPQPGPASGFSRRAVPVSIDRTRRAIDHGLDEYLQYLLDHPPQPKSKEIEPEIVRLSDEDTLDSPEAYPSNVPSYSNRPGLAKSRAQDHATLTLSSPFSQHDDRVFDDQNFNFLPLSPIQAVHRDQRASSHPLQNGSREQSHETQIFRAAESYLAGCLTGCAPLNISFFSVKPTPQRAERPQPQRHVRQQPSDLAITPLSEPEAYLSELDAKTLLLGDVVENGSWWTGKMDSREDPQVEGARERSPERWRGVVSARSPRINWPELAEWYRLILHAGDDWRRRWMSVRSTLSDDKLGRWHQIPMEMLHRNVIDSQIHLQRTFLKAVENLLKRPRRPLKSPEDCRFLLMLLANPLLSPIHRNIGPRPVSEEVSPNVNGSTMPTSPTKTARAPRRNTSNLGRHSGIMKRILGLLAHLSSEVHLYLISWFGRFADARLAGLVDLVGSFVTYRLTRQLNKPVHEEIDPTEGLIPSFSDAGVRHASQIHAALEGRSNATQKQKNDGKPRLGTYGEDWQIRAAARVMALCFQANIGHSARKRDTSISSEQRARSAGLNARHQAYMHGQMIPVSNFYNSMLDHADLVADFEVWETTKSKFTFCQYPFFLSIWAKIHILEHDARRQMESKAREAFFDSILSRKAVSQYLVLKVRRDCLVDDSLKSVSEAIGPGGTDVKKGLRIDFVGEEGVDAGGLRKEWFLLLVREIFNPNFGLFSYDDDSQYCYFNPFCFESSEQFFLVGVLLGLAIYNSTILDVAFPPFLFRKMLASSPPTTDKLTSTPKISYQYSLEDLAELKPSLARGLRQLLEFEGDVQEVFCRDFVIEMERYGGVVQIPLCSGGARRPVTNSNRREFVDMYVHYILDQSVARQYEPFKRGFFQVCGGNALSLFRPEEIELLIRGSDEPLDVNSLRAVASYEGWPKEVPVHEQPQITWFWDFFEKITPGDQRKMLGFITGSDRIPAMGATNLIIRIQLLLDKVSDDAGLESNRLPIARTCFNLLGLYRYHERKTLEQKLWAAVTLSEGFGLK